MPYELKAKDVERRLFICEHLLERQKLKRFLYRIATGDEKWVHYDNPKRRKSWGVSSLRSRRRLNGIFTAPKGHALYLAGPTRRSVLRAVKTD